MAAPSKHDALSLPELSPAPSVLIVVAPFYRAIADNLVAGAQRVLVASASQIEVLEVPGALEVPTAIRLASEANRFEGYVALGCVIRGETTHYETVCNDSSRALSLLGVERGLAIGNGILTCETMAQAQVRADPDDMDKGGGAAIAALHLIALARRFRAQGPAGTRRTIPDDADIILAAARHPRTA